MPQEWRLDFGHGFLLHRRFLTFAGRESRAEITTQGLVGAPERVVDHRPRQSAAEYLEESTVKNCACGRRGAVF